ncbi:MAG: hypothetical protein WB629_08280, partial [Candidatus Sulfotelmatobacter sp.]
HSYDDDRLENGMGEPESVVKNLDVLAHWNPSNLETTLAAGASFAAPHEKTTLANKRKLNLLLQGFNVLR